MGINFYYTWCMAPGAGGCVSPPADDFSADDSASLGWMSQGFGGVSALQKPGANRSSSISSPTF